MSLPEVRARDNARVLLVNGEGRVLLFRCRGLDAGLDNDAFWVTPGGGVDDGEEVAEAATRELFEETGIAARSAELGVVVAVSRGTWCTSDGGVAFRGSDHYFFLRPADRQLDSAGHTELERDVIVGHHWWSTDELRASDERIYPPWLGDVLERLLAGGVPSEPVVLPWETERERVRGCLVGGAVGDALGGAVEFSSRREIIERFGPAGLTTMVSNLITDDTQMTLFTAQGLVDAARAPRRGRCIGRTSTGSAPRLFPRRLWKRKVSRPRAVAKRQGRRTLRGHQHDVGGASRRFEVASGFRFVKIDAAPTGVDWDLVEQAGLSARPNSQNSLCT